MKDVHESVRKRIKGPVYPIPPAFTSDGDMDAGAVARYVRTLYAGGARLFMVTAGTSRLNLLSLAETMELNQVVAQAARSAGKDCLVMAATPAYGSQDQAVEIADRAMVDSCDAVLLYYPDRYYCDDAVLAFFAGISRATTASLMIHGAPIKNAVGGGSSPYSMALCRRLAELDSLVGMKEEFGCEAIRYKIAAHLGQRMPLIVAGASMRKYLGSALYGVPSWLVGVGSFKPEIEERFYRLMQADRLDEARRIVIDIEEPFFDVAMNMGWHLAMRKTLDLLGLMPGHERSPMPVADAAQTDQLREIIRRLGWPPGGEQ